MQTSNKGIQTFSSILKEHQIKFYNSILKDIDDFEDWSIPAEKLLAYYIVARKLREQGES